MEDWQQWRKQARERIIATRMSTPTTVHQQWSVGISKLLQQGFPNLQQAKIGLYWPFRGEYDPRKPAQHFMKIGAVLAMPEVVNKYQPLQFREWWPDAPMKKGAYAIPVPDNTPHIVPDVLIVPMIGFDMQGYRLGYGGGYYDRTLAGYSHVPCTIGVAFELQRMETVHPQSHDVAMQYVVTEAGIFKTDQRELKMISVEQCASQNFVI